MKKNLNLLLVETLAAAKGGATIVTVEELLCPLPNLTNFLNSKTHAMK